MSVVIKAIVSYYKSNEQTPIERYKSRIGIEDKATSNLGEFKSLVLQFLGVKERVKKYGFGEFDLKLFRIAKVDGKTENFAIHTQDQFDLEKHSLFQGESELNVHVIQIECVNWTGKVPIVINQKSHQPRGKKNTQPNSRKRKTQQEVQEDRELKKKINDGHNKGIERNERQRTELQKLDVELNKLGGSVAVNEATIKCGICSRQYASNCSERSIEGKVAYFNRGHYARCLKKKERNDKDLQNQKNIKSFFKSNSSLQSKETSSDAQVSQVLEVEDFDGADALILDNELIDTQCLSLSDLTDDSDSEIVDDMNEIDESTSNDISTSNLLNIQLMELEHEDEYDSSESGSEESGDDEFLTSNICIENAHPLAIKLNKLLKEGKIPENCIYYKFINDTTSFAMIDSNAASNFKWDDEVCEFFQTIKYLGGKRTLKFVRGPGFFGTGRGGKKQFSSFADFNLCGPSMNVSKRNHAGYTTLSGVIKRHLQSFHTLSQHPKANVHKIVETEKVKIVPVALASDGTALKPGLEYDQSSKTVIGLTHKVDASFVKDHPVPDPLQIKKNLVTSADVTCAISLDNNVTMPVAVHYRPKSVSREDIFSSMENEIKTIQICEKCVERKHSEKHIITCENIKCSSKCDECLSLKSVCDECRDKGQISHLTSLRACDACLEKQEVCRKLVVLAVSTDCESCNKKALLDISDKADSQTLPPEMELVVPLPDVVHLGKSIKCSWSNWFINLDGQFSNLVLLRTLRDDGDPHTKKQLRKLLSLECVRNKDRMAVDPIIRITRPHTHTRDPGPLYVSRGVLAVLQNVELVVHTIVPEKYRFWKSNQPGVCPRPTAICPGPLGSLLVLDYNFDTSMSRLLTVRLHQPADVSVIKEGFKDARDLCYSDGVVYIAERGSSVISFIDLTGKVKIKVDSLRKKDDLICHLQRFRLNTTGAIPVLRARLQKHLETMSKGFKSLECVQMQCMIKQPSSICKVNEELLICTDDDQRAVNQIALSFDGVTIHGTIVKLFSYPDGTTNVNSICVFGTNCYFSDSSINGGLFVCDLSTSKVEKIYNNSQESEVNCICTFMEQVVFTDSKAGKVRSFNPTEKSVRVLLGSGQNKPCDGTHNTCSFAQLQGICQVENTLFLTDVLAGSIKLITGLSGTIRFLQMLGLLYDSFGIHSKGVHIDTITLKTAVENLKKIDHYVKTTVTRVRNHNNLKEGSATNGTEGTISNQTQKSLSLLSKGIERLNGNLMTINSTFAEDIKLESLLTSQVENLHAVSHFKHQTFSVLQYAQDFGTIVKESLKRTTKWAAKYYTHDTSYYPVPDSAMPLSAAKVMTPLSSEEISHEIETTLKNWMESYRPVRQRTVRSETTKDKAGALPPAVYTKVNEVLGSTVEFPDDKLENINPKRQSRCHASNAENITITFVDESNVNVAIANSTSVDKIDEYDTDSEDDQLYDLEDHTELAVNPGCVTRSGRAVKAFLRLDL